MTDDLRVTSYMEAMLPLSWAALLAGILALLVSLYLLFIKVGIDIRRLKHDYHYKLRWYLCICLVLNRLINIIHQVITTKIATWPNQTTKTWQVYGHELLPLRKTEFALYLMNMISYYIILCLIYLLTVDRYKRVSMVLPGSRMAIILKGLQYAILFIISLVVILYLVDYLPRIVPGIPLHRDEVVRYITSARYLTEIVTISVAVALDYFFTIRLIVISTRSIDDRVLQPARTANSSQLKTRSPVRWLNLSKCTSPTLATKMRIYFAIITLIDLSSLTTITLSSLNILSFHERDQFDLLISTLGSWLAIRVLVVFLLLDLFLKNLKTEKEDRNVKKRPLFKRMRMKLHRVFQASWGWSRASLSQSSIGSFLSMPKKHSHELDSITAENGQTQSATPTQWEKATMKRSP